MKKLTRAQFDKSNAWVHRNARPVDLAMWRALFEDGSKQDFLSELRFYQNDDGGFGNKLEPDNWNPASTCTATEYAIRLSKQLGVQDSELGDIKEGLIRFIGGDSCYGENGWQFRIPSNNDYPHAIWWTYSEREEYEENIGMTAQLGLFALKNAPKDSEAYRRASREIPRLMECLKHGKLGDMAANGYLTLLIEAPDMVKGYEQLILDTINKGIERDSAKWKVYCKLPSDYIFNAQSPLYKYNEQLVETELQYILDNWPSDGSWDITWQWYDEGKYADAFPIARNWWRTQKTIEKLMFLRAFGRLDF